MLFAHVSSALYLLEQAIWSQKCSDADHEVYVLVFIQWVEEGGLKVASEEVKTVMNAGIDRAMNDKMMVFGSSSRAKVKL